MPKVCILGATGYTGLELVRLLTGHPEVEITGLTSEKQAGKNFSEVFPGFQGICDLKLQPLQSTKLAKEANFVFSCLPHKESMAIVPSFLEKGCRVVDLSADFRLRSSKIYGEWYEPHKAPELLKEAVYGLPEVYREAIKKATLVANPGCYPTASLLALLPLIQGKLASVASPDGIICDAKSGISGAGRSAALESLFCEVNDSVTAYKLTTHRHTPEIEQELSRAAGREVKITFTPHLIPMDRGLLVTAYANALRKVETKDLIQIFKGHYKKEPFVMIYPEGKVPSTKSVRGTNFCHIGLAFNERTNQIIVVSAIDNLVKGASGQAVQNMNLMCGFSEKTGLEKSPLQP